MKDLIKANVKGAPPKSVEMRDHPRKSNVFLQWILAIPAFIIIPITYLGGIAIHIWTVIIAYNEYNIWVAGISFLTPVFSTLYFIYDTWRYIGFLNTYILVILGYLALIFINLILTSTIQKLDQNR